MNNLQSGTITVWVKWTGAQSNFSGAYGAVLGRQSDGEFSNNIIALSGSDPANAQIVFRPYN